MDEITVQEQKEHFQQQLKYLKICQNHSLEAMKLLCSHKQNFRLFFY